MFAAALSPNTAHSQPVYIFICVECASACACVCVCVHVCLSACLIASSSPASAPNTKELDVFIKRDQESGFGFRVLGGEGPEQPVSKLQSKQPVSLSYLEKKC